MHTCIHTYIHTYINIGSTFVYQQHEGFLKVNNVFVEVYNDQPDHPIENPYEFAAGLVDIINYNISFLLSEDNQNGLPVTMGSDVAVAAKVDNNSENVLENETGDNNNAS